MIDGQEYLSLLPAAMRYARASEASTLFINESVAKTPPYLKFINENNIVILEDFDGKTLRNYLITKITKQNKELTLTLTNRAKANEKETYFVIYPYWDIDDAFVVIQKIPGQEENPVKWAIAEKYASRIEVYPEGYP